LPLLVHYLLPSRVSLHCTHFRIFYALIMPPKIAKKGTNSQTQRAIALTQASSPDPAPQQDAETQADADTQVDEDDPSSSAVDDGLASTADGAAASTANTTHTSADEADTKPAAKRPAGKTVAAATDKKDGEGKKKKKRKLDPTNFQVYIFKGLTVCLPIVVFQSLTCSSSSEAGAP
jgi:hypothetical protein